MYCWFRVPRNLEIRMKTKSLPYLQNYLEFFQQSGNKLYDFRCVVYIDGRLWRHEYKKSRTISG